MNLQEWQAAARQNLTRLAGSLRRLAPDTLYGFLAAATLLPVVTAANQGDFAALATLGSVIGGVGGNLVANQIQAWKDRSQAELAADLQQAATSHPAWRDELDKVLERLDAIQAVRQTLEAADRTWFQDALKQELTALGNLSKFEAQLSGTGAIAQGDRATAAQSRSIAAQRLEGLAITGDNNVVKVIVSQYGKAPGKAVADELLRGHIERYLKWVGERYGAIELRGIERQGRQVIQLDLDTVYVPLAATDFQMTGGSSQIDLNHILACGPRLVITGGPGSGKTTVLQHIAWTLTLALFQDQPALAAERVGLPLEKDAALPLPIFVPLSAYAQHRRSLPATSQAQQRTLASFISHYLIDKQTTLRLPADFFARLLNEGQTVLLLLDGLDEVPDDDERAMVREAIQDLVAGKDRLRVVVTCRTVAYKERTVLARGFREVQVLPLADQHITQLVTQAYAAIHPADADAQRDKTAHLLDGIRSLEAERQRRLGERAEPLVTSPLMVRLLLIVQENERRLPDQRAELYMKATDNLLLPDYLLDEAAASRLGRLVQDKETHREMVQHLAFQMHQAGEQQGRDIDEERLRQVFQGSPYAELAGDLIRITRLRGTLLEERNRRYRFVHLSFQEFLAARHLAEVVRGNSGIEGIARFLEGGPILESWWREPALLVVGYLSKASPPNAQTLVRRLAGVDSDAAARHAALAADVQMAAAAVAATAFREWSPWPVGEDALRRELGQRLQSLITSPGHPVWRATVGNSLAKLGDDRPAVMTIEGMQFCFVPAGPFTMGSGEQEPGADSDEKPQHMVDLAYDYWIGRYPVTNAQFQSFVDDGGYRIARYWSEAANTGYWRPVNSKATRIMSRVKDQDRTESRTPCQITRWWGSAGMKRWPSRAGWASVGP